MCVVCVCVLCVWILFQVTEVNFFHGVVLIVVFRFGYVWWCLSVSGYGMWSFYKKKVFYASCFCLAHRTCWSVSRWFVLLWFCGD